MLLPTTRDEMNALNWQDLDVILISGDTYIDSPYNGCALIGRVLLNAGYRVGIIAQPDPANPADIARLGEPLLFWVSPAQLIRWCQYHRTQNHVNAMTHPGGINNRRPDRATIAYTNLIRRNLNTRPIVLGGIEASLRRISHYDYWTNKIRGSVLLDAKADYLLYGMG